MAARRDPRYVDHLIFTFGSADTKKIKRVERKFFMVTPVYDAYQLGDADAYAGRKMRTSLYAPGKRRNDYIRGYKNADPMGDYHGSNY